MCSGRVFAVTADVASQSRVKSGRRQLAVGPQERDGNSSLGGAPRKHGVRAGVVDILPTGRVGGEVTRLPRRLCFAMHLVASLCRRGLASEDYELHNGRFTELESRWHQQ